MQEKIEKYTTLIKESFRIREENNFINYSNDVNYIEINRKINEISNELFDISADNYRYLLSTAQSDYTKTIKKIAESKVECKQFTIEYLNKSEFWIAARVLQKRGYPAVKDCIYEMLDWFLDFNWPGAIEIYELLLTIPNEELRPHIIKKKEYAINNREEEMLDDLLRLAAEKGIKLDE